MTSGHRSSQSRPAACRSRSGSRVRGADRVRPLAAAAPARPYLPPEISGLVVVLIAVALGSLAFRSLLGIGLPQPEHLPHFIVAALTLGSMVGLSVWAEASTDLLRADRHGRRLCDCGPQWRAHGGRSAGGQAAPLLSPPGFAGDGWSWHATLAIPFAVAALANCVRTIGDVTICQKMNDADWVRPDMDRSAAACSRTGSRTSRRDGRRAGVNTLRARRARRGDGRDEPPGRLRDRRDLLVLAFMPKASAVFWSCRRR